MQAIIEKALEKDRDLRYQSAAEMLADLKRVKREIETHQRATGMTLPQDRPARILRLAPGAIRLFGQSAAPGTVFETHHSDWYSNCAASFQ